jgi:hypothetical protein
MVILCLCVKNIYDYYIYLLCKFFHSRLHDSNAIFLKIHLYDNMYLFWSHALPWKIELGVLVFFTIVKTCELVGCAITTCSFYIFHFSLSGHYIITKVFFPFQMCNLWTWCSCLWSSNCYWLLVNFMCFLVL